ncbi:MAG TPA: amidohydrolase family protein [Woeseiaceae bacterium]|nr:amidohydrolase family protein [Woeseiaceae bacterium]
MKRLLACGRVVGFAVAISGLGAVAAADAATEIVNVRVVDVRNGSISEPSLVRIENGRIEAISRLPDGREKTGDFIDGTGKYLVPGFWDMHAHVNNGVLASEWMFPLLVAYGVTGVRDMLGDCWAPGCDENIDHLREVQAAIASGAVIGPRILAIGSDLVGGPRAAYEGLPEWAAPLTGDQGRKLADIAQERGVDFIKVYDTLPRKAWFALMAEARRIGIPVAGHVPKSVSMLEAIEAGQISIEHAKYPAIDCSAFAPVFRGVFSRWAAGESAWIYGSWADDPAGTHNLGGYYQHVLASFDGELCEHIISEFAASDAYYVPTLITRRFEALADDAAFLDDARLGFVPQKLREEWQADSDAYKEQFGDPAEKHAYLEFYRLARRLVGDIHRAGVPVLIGTDTPDSYSFPGSGYHEELLQMQAAGLSNTDILRAATYDAAEVLGMEDFFGSVDVGKVADMVLLEANPVADIANASRIAGVFLEGRFLDARMLQGLRDRARSFAAEH